MSTSLSYPSPGNDVMNDVIDEAIENGRNQCLPTLVTEEDTWG